jgi:hypothetical protein
VVPKTTVYVKRFDYGLRRPANQAAEAEPRSFDLTIRQILRSGIDTNKLANHPGPPLLEGQADWQDGFHLWKAEGLNPADFISVVATTHAAICVARKEIGSLWCAGEPEPDPGEGHEPTKLIFLTQRREEPLGSLNEGPDARGVLFSVHRLYEWKDEAGTLVEEIDEPAALTGMVDGQHGITLYRREHMEPDEFISIMACAHEAICAARKMIGSNWHCSEPQSDPVAA